MGSRPASTEPARVTCVLPGLVWPGAGITASLQQLELPGLATLLGRARLIETPGQAWSRWLADCFGVEGLPWAASRWAGECAEAACANILCADPVSLAFTSRALLLRGPRELALQPDEIAALIATLNAEFGNLGKWIATSPEHWYLLAHKPVCARFYPLADVLGRPASLFQPEGEEAAQWNRIANDIQITLHNHPVNQTRSARGQLTANALWFWGSASTQSTSLQAPASALLGADPILQGLAQHTGMCRIDSADRLCAGLPGHTWWADTRLHEATLGGDFTGWLRALQEIDAYMLQPLLKAWRSGRVTEILLQAPSDKILLSARLPHPARWAFWRKPLDAAQLAARLQTQCC